MGKNKFQWFWQGWISHICWLGVWFGALLISLGLVVAPAAIAQPRLAASPITVDISLGSPEGDLQFVPKHLEGYQLKPGQVDCSRDWAVVTKTTV